MKEVENCNGLRGSTGRLHHKPYGGETGFDMQTIDDWSYRLVTLGLYKLNANDNAFMGDYALAA